MRVTLCAAGFLSQDVLGKIVWDASGALPHESVDFVEPFAREQLATKGDRNDIRDHDGTSRNERAWNAHVKSQWHDGHANRGSGRYERRDGSSLHDDIQEVHWRNEGRLRVRRESLGDHASKPVQHDARWAVQLLLHDERNDGLLLQPDDGHVQVRADR
jgi:hypothetical protein